MKTQQHPHKDATPPTRWEPSYRAESPQGLPDSRALSTICCTNTITHKSWASALFFLLIKTPLSLPHGVALLHSISHGIQALNIVSLQLHMPNPLGSGEDIHWSRIYIISGMKQVSRLIKSNSSQLCQLRALFTVSRWKRLCKEKHLEDTSLMCGLLNL